MGAANQAHKVVQFDGAPRRPDANGAPDRMFFDENAEAALVSHVIMGYPHVSLNDLLFLDPDWFQSEKWSALWRLVRDHAIDGKPCDITAIEAAYTYRFGHEAAFDVVMEITQAANTGTYHTEEYYADLIAKYYRRRCVLNTASNLVRAVTNDDDDAMRAALDEVHRVLVQTGMEQGESSLSAAFAAMVNETEISMASDALIQTFLTDLDRKLGPIAPGTLMTIGGTASHGKSALSKTIGVNYVLEQAYKRDHKPDFRPGTVEYFTFEVTAREQSLRVAAQLAQINPREFLFGFRYRPDPITGAMELDITGKPDEGAFMERSGQVAGVLERVSDLLHFHDQPLDAEGICRRIREIKRRRNVQIVIIDASEYVLREGKSPVVEYERMFQRFKQCAEEEHIVIIVLHQFSSDIDSRISHIPVIDDLKWGKAAETASDVVLLLNRVSKWWPDDIDEEWTAATFVTIAKNRKTGLGVGKWVTLAFDEGGVAFSDWPHELWDQKAMMTRMRERARADSKGEGDGYGGF